MFRPPPHRQPLWHSGAAAPGLSWLFFSASTLVAFGERVVVRRDLDDGKTGGKVSGLFCKEGVGWGEAPRAGKL